jgi:hypothetical protein
VTDGVTSAHVQFERKMREGEKKKKKTKDEDKLQENLPKLQSLPRVILTVDPGIVRPVTMALFVDGKPNVFSLSTMKYRNDSGSYKAQKIKTRQISQAKLDKFYTRLADLKTCNKCSILKHLLSWFKSKEATKHWEQTKRHNGNCITKPKLSMNSNA